MPSSRSHQASVLLSTENVRKVVFVLALIESMLMKAPDNLGIVEDWETLILLIDQ